MVAFLTWTQLGTVAALAIAGLSLVVSVLVALDNRKHSVATQEAREREQRGTLHVRLWQQTYHEPSGFERIERHDIVVRAINISGRPTTCNGFWIETEDEQEVFVVAKGHQPDYLPYTLSPYEHWNCLLIAQILIDNLRKTTGQQDPPWRIRAVFRDVADEHHPSDWFDYDPHPSLISPTT